jgi:hypothetical protein
MVAMEVYVGLRAKSIRIIYLTRNRLFPDITKVFSCALLFQFPVSAHCQTDHIQTNHIQTNHIQTLTQRL